MRHPARRGSITRDQLLDWYRSGRSRTRKLFAIPRPECYYERPIALRNPIVFYEGHLPAFAVNTLIKLALKKEGVNSDYEQLFERGIDPDDEKGVGNGSAMWPSRDKVQAYGAAADAAIEHAIRCDRIVDENVPQLRGGEAALCLPEHELMHQETLLYMFHNLPYDKKIRREAPSEGRPSSGLRPPSPAERRLSIVSIPAGIATLGSEHDFGWDNEFPAHSVEVDSFTIDRYNVTNGEYLE
ncbi:MAG TPA: SUMF1/EgtB/PvdO family nonheme iron enzyme, partial [Thermoanaerobaculia bacterium]